MSEQLIKDLKQLLNTLESSGNSNISRIGNAGCPKQEILTKFEVKDESKNYKYVCKDLKMDTKTSISVEVLAQIEGFLPKTLQMIVKNSETKQDTIIEIANITVMGDPQLVNFNGIREPSMRGISLVFKESQDWIDFVSFGAWNGQGLVFDLINPNNYNVDISIIISGLNVSCERIGMR